MALSFNEEDLRTIDGSLDNFLDRGISDLIEGSSESIADQMTEILRRRWPRQHKEEKRRLSMFARRMQDTWGEPLSNLRMLVTVSRELGSHYNETSDKRRDKFPALIEVLVRLHARACQITEEIIVLLSHGLADGAFARWRILHEIAVVALFLRENGEEVAKRYIAHQTIESWRAALQYREYQTRLDLDPITDEKFSALRFKRDSAITTFGDDFAETYGWASQQLGISKPTFAQIEHAIKIDHLRPYYRLASHNVHANPKGAFFRLGITVEHNVLLSGFSNLGLADPGQNAALSLAQITISLLTTEPTFDEVVGAKIIERMQAATSEAFINAHRELEQTTDQVSTQQTHSK